MGARGTDSNQGRRRTQLRRRHVQQRRSRWRASQLHALRAERSGAL